MPPTSTIPVNESAAQAPSLMVYTAILAIFAALTAGRAPVAAADRDECYLLAFFDGVGSALGQSDVF